MSAVADIPRRAPEAGSPPASRAGRWPVLVVWGVWAIMVAVVLAHIARYGQNVPIAEDWLMVPTLTGQEPDFWAWVWSQNNEHRIPLARLLYLGLLAPTQDFRVGMVGSTLLLAAFAAAMILVARRLRGGRTSYVDAFFPLAVLHLGNWENLVWGWQITFVVGTVAIGALLLVLVASEMPLGERSALVLAATLVALPLTGANGLVYVAAGIAAAAALVWRLRRLGGAGLARGRPAAIVVGGALLAAIVAGLYFVGYERPTWTDENPGASPTVETVGKFGAMALGPGPIELGRAGQALVLLAVAGVVAIAGVVLAQRILRGRADAERRRALALTGFLAGAVVMALAIGYGRAATAVERELPARYALLSLPAVLAAWFVVQRYGRAALRGWVHGGLLLLTIALLPLNVAKGYEWRDWYLAGMNAVERDIDAGVPRDALVERHQTFLLHWDAVALGEGIDTLRDERIGPFARLRDEPPATPRRAGP